MIQAAVVFGGEIKKAVGRFADFTRRHKAMLAILVVSLFFLYGVRLFYYDLSIDSEIGVSGQETLLRSWLAINRFGLVATKKIFGLTRFVPYASNFLMLFVLGFSAFFLSFCMEEWRGRAESSKWFYYIFPVAYISAPCLAEQFYFSVQSFEISWAALLCIMAAYCISRTVFHKESVFWIFPGVIFMIWAFGSYQAFAGMLIALVLTAFVFYYQNEAFTMPGRHGWLLAGIWSAVIFGAGFAGYLAVAKGVRFCYHLESAYLDNMFFWKTLDVSTCIGNIKGDIWRIYFGGWPVFFRKIFLPGMIIFVILSVYRGWRRKRGEYWVYLAAVGLLLLSPLYLTLIGGAQQPIRGQIVYPLVLALFLGEMTTLRNRLVSGVLCVVAVFVISRQGNIMTQLFHTAYQVYEQDKELAGAVYGRISQAEADSGLSGCPVVFVGARGACLPDDALRGDVIGFSFFEWDAEGYAGSTARIVDFCSTLGYRLELPDEGQVAAAREHANTMPAWPATGSVQVKDQVVVVKLSEGSKVP